MKGTLQRGRPTIAQSADKGNSSDLRGGATQGAPHSSQPPAAQAAKEKGAQRLGELAPCEPLRSATTRCNTPTIASTIDRGGCRAITVRLASSTWVVTGDALGVGPFRASSDARAPSTRPHTMGWPGLQPGTSRYRHMAESADRDPNSYRAEASDRLRKSNSHRHRRNGRAGGFLGDPQLHIGLQSICRHRRHVGLVQRERLQRRAAHGLDPPPSLNGGPRVIRPCHALDSALGPMGTPRCRATPTTTPILSRVSTADNIGLVGGTRRHHHRD